MTNQPGLQTLLRLPPDQVVLIEALIVERWGQVLILRCVLPPSAGQSEPFELRFTDCRDLRWRVYAHETEGERPNAIVDFSAGKSAHRSPAHILTERVGLTVWYGSLWVKNLLV